MNTPLSHWPENYDDLSDLTFEMTKQQWKDVLTGEQHAIMRKHSTERAFTGDVHDEKRKGIYRCRGCGRPLFSSEAKYDSGTGWPSYYDSIYEESIETSEDRKLFMKRTEVHCKRCKSHLGHVFTDGPRPTGLRYCMNSASLCFEHEDT